MLFQSPFLQSGYSINHVISYILNSIKFIYDHLSHCHLLPYYHYYNHPFITIHYLWQLVDIAHPLQISATLISGAKYPMLPPKYPM